MANNYGGDQYGHQQNTYGGGQYSRTTYGAQGDGDGGGFMPGSQSASQGAGKPAHGQDTVRAVTILQANTAQPTHTDGEFFLDNSEVTHISLVGQIRNISKQTTNITYKLDDGTGTIEVKVWRDVENDPVDDEGNEVEMKDLQTGEWARVWGKLKEYNSRRHLQTHVMRPIVDKNEINYHLLEATYTHLYFTRGPPEQFAAVDKSGGAHGGANDHAQHQTGYGSHAMPSLSPLAQKMYNALQNEPQNNEGLHAQNLAAICRLSIGDIQKASDELVNLHLIFATVDDHTWALLEQP